MDLFLWRHADAVEVPEADAVLDLERALTPKGERQAKRMAAWLNGFLPDSTRVLVSPAKRAQQTAQALERKFQTRDTLLPTASVEALLNETRWPDRREPVLVVGHQPTLGQAAALLMAGPAFSASGPQASPMAAMPSWAVRKGAVWWLRARVRGGVPEVVLMTVRSPDTL